VESYKLFVFTLSACMAGVAGALYVPQVGIINPSEFDPGNSIEAVIWVAVGGRGTLVGAALGAVVVNFAKTYFTAAFPEYWLFGLGALFVRVSFDGYKALRSLSLTLEPGEMRAIIGPNGAGKTTMMDVITGKTRPDEGVVYFDGRHNLLVLDEAEIAQLGVGRKFQKPTVFENHTVSDNLLLATKAPRAVFATLFGREDT